MLYVLHVLFLVPWAYNILVRARDGLKRRSHVTCRPCCIVLFTCSVSQEVGTLLTACVAIFTGGSKSAETGPKRCGTPPWAYSGRREPAQTLYAYLMARTDSIESSTHVSEKY